MLAGGLGQIPPDDGWLPTVAILGELCASLDDADRADPLAATLLPYADRCALVPTGLGCLGPVAHVLGRLAATVGDWKQADEHFGRAVDVGRRMAAPALVARSRHEHAVALLRSDEPGAEERAGQLTAQAGATARRLGMAPLLARLADADPPGRAFHG